MFELLIKLQLAEIPEEFIESIDDLSEDEYLYIRYSDIVSMIETTNEDGIPVTEVYTADGTFYDVKETASKINKLGEEAYIKSKNHDISFKNN